MIAHKIALMDVKLLMPHERVDEARLPEVAAEVIAEGLLRKPIVADLGSLTVIDGHHRLEFLKRVGATVAPVALVDYWDPRIIVARWDGGGFIDKRVVVSRAARGELFPPKTTRHVFSAGDRTVHISEVIPSVNIELRALLEHALARAELARLSAAYSAASLSLKRSGGAPGDRRRGRT